MSPGPPFPGVTEKLYDNSEIYWDITPDGTPGHLKFVAVDGTVIQINRQTGAVTRGPSAT